MKITTRITVETETLTIIRRSKAVRGWCPDCQAEVNLITLKINPFTKSSKTTPIGEWLATDKVHVLHPANGPAQICITSLLACFESTEAQRAFRYFENETK